MIPVPFITEWSDKAPWVADSFVEQDLIITRALTDIFSDEFLGDTTGLLRPQLEYDPLAAWERVRDEIVAKLLPSK